LAIVEWHHSLVEYQAHIGTLIRHSSGIAAETLNCEVATHGNDVSGDEWISKRNAIQRQVLIRKENSQSRDDGSDIGVVGAVLVSMDFQSKK
jgi:hypothetical protein